MVKLAILITGEYRTFDICRKYMTFLNDPDIDIYISTWDKTVYKNSKINLHVEEEVTLSRIEEILGRSALIEIETCPVGLEKYSSKMIYKWLRAVTLIENTPYDYVLFVRPDILFADASHIIDNLNTYKESIGVEWYTLTQLHDIFFIVPYSHLRELFPKSLLEDWLSDTDTEWHAWWFSWVKKTSLKIIHIPNIGGFTICRYSDKRYNTFSEYAELQKNWRHLHRLESIDIIGLSDSIKRWPAAKVAAAIKMWRNGDLDKYIVPR